MSGRIHIAALVLALAVGLSGIGCSKAEPASPTAEDPNAGGVLEGPTPGPKPDEKSATPGALPRPVRAPRAPSDRNPTWSDVANRFQVLEKRRAELLGLLRDKPLRGGAARPAARPGETGREGP